MGAFGIRSFWPLVAPLSDEPDAGAMPTASRRRHVGHAAVMTAAKAKPGALRVAERPPASIGGKLVDLPSSGEGNQFWCQLERSLAMGNGGGVPPIFLRSSGAPAWNHALIESQIFSACNRGY